jgi:drug/metabolite transporter (DMT)-like permease
MSVEAKSPDTICTACAEGMAVSSIPTVRAATLPDRLTLAAFAGFILLSGSAAIAVRYAYQELAPFWLGFMRFGLSGLIFWVLVLTQRIPIPRGRALAGAAVFGTLSVGVTFIFYAWGLVETPASVFAIIVSLMPLLTLFFASAHRIERISSRGLIGALIAVAGIIVILGSSLRSGVQFSPLHFLSIFIGAACLAESGVIGKLIPRSHPIAINAIAMTVGAPMLLAASLITGESKSLPISPGIWLTLIYLVVCGSTVFTLYLFVLSRWTASGASYAFVLNPIVTILLAAILVGEPITWIFLAGGALVLSGVWVGALAPNGST